MVKLYVMPHIKLLEECFATVLARKRHVLLSLMSPQILFLPEAESAFGAIA
jgi:hypothetical protein